MSPSSSEPPLHRPPDPNDARAGAPSPRPPRPVRDSAAVEPSAQPYSESELLAALWQPHRGLEIALGRRERLVASLTDDRSVLLLAGLLLLLSLVAALPYGVIAPTSPRGGTAVPDVLRVVSLYLGSVALCLPSLLVFATFLELPLRGARMALLAALLCAVAAAFSFGFFPITWFIDLTTDSQAEAAVSVHSISTTLLVFGLVIGMVQMILCLQAARVQRGTALLGLLLTCWIVLLAGIVDRMAGVLHLW